MVPVFFWYLFPSSDLTLVASEWLNTNAFEGRAAGFVDVIETVGFGAGLCVVVEGDAVAQVFATFKPPPILKQLGHFAPENDSVWGHCRLTQNMAKPPSRDSSRTLARRGEGGKDSLRHGGGV